MRDKDTFGKISAIALAMLVTAALAAGCGKGEPAAAPETASWLRSISLSRVPKDSEGGSAICSIR